MARGRPRTFDLDRALDQALKVFWQKGYEGTSLLDLTEAMGINRPSLYAAFGNKEALFRKAIARYVEGPAARVLEALNQPKARDVAAALLRQSIELTTDNDNPRGCFMVQGALACSKDSDPLRQEMSRCRSEMERLIRERFQRAIDEGDLPKDANPADLARYLTVVSNGFAVQAASGVGRDELYKIAEIAMNRWPGSNTGPA